MKIAVLSDIHSNFHALQAVIEDIQLIDDIDHIINLGDVVGYGAYPNECINIIKNKAKISLMGNHDYAACDFMNYSFFNSFARTAIEFTRKEITEEGLSFLKKLPFTYSFDSNLFVHSSPIFPESWTYILNKKTANFIFTTIEKDAKTIFIGHSHIPIVFLNEGSKIRSWYGPKIYLEESPAIINVGSVGQPRDRDVRACYAIYDLDERSITYRRVQYDIDAAFETIIAKGLPPVLAERLKRGK
jgi:diadenosine tetraphosphatase ApaH/serine/threonine PP2A family protein phosphatase